VVGGFFRIIRISRVVYVFPFALRLFGILFMGFIDFELKKKMAPIFSMEIFFGIFF
jgi:hypothetical protein